MTWDPPRSAYTGTWSGQRMGPGGRYLYTPPELTAELDRRIARVDEVHGPGSSWGLTRIRRVVELDGWDCAYCGCHLVLPPAAPRATIDHVMPKALGGAGRSISNMVLACGPCNAAKSDQLPILRWLPRHGLDRLVYSGQRQYRHVVTRAWAAALADA